LVNNDNNEENENENEKVDLYEVSEAVDVVSKGMSEG
jgi:hypothetical protein